MYVVWTASTSWFVQFNDGDDENDQPLKDTDDHPEIIENGWLLGRRFVVTSDSVDHFLSDKENRISERLVSDERSLKSISLQVT